MFAGNTSYTGLASATGFTSTDNYTAPAQTANFGSAPINTTFLFVGRYTSDGITSLTGTDSVIGPGLGAGGDTFEVWYNPSNVSSIASLGAANFLSNDQDFFSRTNFMDGISLAARGDGVTLIDSLRVSYGGTTDENFGAVMTAIPEPGTVGLLAFSLTTVMVLRRRRRSE